MIIGLSSIFYGINGINIVIMIVMDKSIHINLGPSWIKAVGNPIIYYGKVNVIH